MKDFIFHVPTKILFGKDQMKNLAGEIKKYGDRVLLAYGGGSIKRTGLYDEIVKIFEDNNIFYKELSGIEPNPRVESAVRGVEIVRENELNFILAVGGGSVIDLSKLIAGAVFLDCNPWDIVIKKEKITKALPIGTILTLSATGSEMDSGGVITNLETKQKLSFGSKYTLPKFSILNPEITYTVNEKHTAAGVADIMSHTMENYFTLNDGAYMQNRLAEGILKTCIHFGPIALENPTNYDARANLMWASSWAINGLLDTGKETPWSVHAMEHELSAFYDLTHGIGLAILTPRFLSHILNDDTVDMIRDFGINVFNINKTDDKFKDAKAAIGALHMFFEQDMKIPMSLTEVGIDEKHLEEMAENAAKHAGGSIRGVVELNKDDILKIYKACL
ncbi:iron-containing alcohol dehydrogenase [Peptoniphilus sp. MSJ-1]|uniref:Iron-containing alcohol dehydrogenase n=1 Tax=Peptoniphilus ovalis TaxID=2841503 RepID=A0ABS6FIC6_9FIRM|nr:iron-containing alcohol dehydrogenase [Peptoniphilus ovalis]MBU5669924.1 iron-containing alcohol dehydrogenase [Peptoniphilus ovalis]